MSKGFDIESRKTNGDLHLDLFGDFDIFSAWKLVDAIKTHYDGNGLIIINTENIGEIMAFGREVLVDLMTANNMSRDKLLFEGTKGFEIKPADWKKAMRHEIKPCRCYGWSNTCDCAK